MSIHGSFISPAIDQLVRQFKALPGIGPKSAQRLALLTPLLSYPGVVLTPPARSKLAWSLTPRRLA